jgi:hypothetical protein
MQKSQVDEFPEGIENLALLINEAAMSHCLFNSPIPLNST